MGDDTDVVFTADQIAEASTALRTALGLRPEHFTLARFIEMVSGEVEQLRAKSWSDTEIAALLAESTGSVVSAQNLADYCMPGDRDTPPQS